MTKFGARYLGTLSTGTHVRPEMNDAHSLLNVVKDWHDDAHDGPFSFCDQRPCSDLREAVRSV